MENLREHKQRIIKQTIEGKQQYETEIIYDKDFPQFFTHEVLSILDISRATLYRIRRALKEENSDYKPYSNKSQGKKSWKNRYSTNEIERIKDYIRRQNEYQSPWNPNK